MVMIRRHRPHDSDVARFELGTHIDLVYVC